MIRKEITFDMVVRSLMVVIIAVAILALLNRLSGVLLPFFVAWLISYLIFPMVQFFQYKCKLKYRIIADCNSCGNWCVHPDCATFGDRVATYQGLTV